MFPQGDVRIIFPKSLEEARNAKDSYPDAIIRSTLSFLLGLSKPDSNPSVIIELSTADDLNFFVEDHALWFIGAALPPDELLNTARERIPALGVILREDINLALETPAKWIFRHNGRIHISTAAGMEIYSIPQDIRILEQHTAFQKGIPCMISIQKSEVSGK